MKIVNGDDWILVSNEDSRRCHSLCQYMDLKVRRERGKVFATMYCRRTGHIQLLTGTDEENIIFPQRTFKCKLKFNYLGMEA